MTIKFLNPVFECYSSPEGKTEHLINFATETLDTVWILTQTKLYFAHWEANLYQFTDCLLTLTEQSSLTDDWLTAEYVKLWEQQAG